MDELERLRAIEQATRHYCESADDDPNAYWQLLIALCAGSDWRPRKRAPDEVVRSERLSALLEAAELAMLNGEGISAEALRRILKPKDDSEPVYQSVLAGWAAYRINELESLLGGVEHTVAHYLWPQPGSYEPGWEELRRMLDAVIAAKRDPAPADADEPTGIDEPANVRRLWQPRG